MPGVGSAVDFFDMVGQTEWNQSVQRTLIHWMGLSGSEHVLDVGCGVGRFTALMAGRVEWITGVDISQAMIHRAQAISGDFGITNTSFVAGDIQNLSFPDKQFDLVTCLNLLYTLGSWEAALAELMRVVRPGGQIILLNPSPDMNPWAAQSYCEQCGLSDFERESFLSWALAAARQHFLTPESLERMVQNAGGKIEESTYILDNLAWVAKIVASDA